MKKQIKHFVRKCETCQVNKITKHIRMPMRITSTARRPFEQIAIDVVGPLPVSFDGNSYLLAFQDDLTRLVGAVALPNQETDTVARAFINNVVLRYGIPESVLTDQGTSFLSELMNNVFKLLKSKRKTCSAYHPECNGGLTEQLRIICGVLCRKI